MEGVRAYYCHWQGQLATLSHEPRPLRVEHPGALYHVMGRGDRREAIFRDDDAAFTGRVLPEVTIRCGLHAEVEYMGRIRSRGGPAGESRWKLMVHQELHAAASTV